MSWTEVRVAHRTLAGHSEHECMNSTVHGREHYVTQQVTQLPVQNLKSMGKAWHGQSMHATWCVNAGALQGAGLCLQRSCTVMQLRERRLFSMQLVLRVCSCVPRSTDVTTSAGFRAAGRPARNPAMPGGDARIQIKCDAENENPRFDCFN